MQKKHKTVIDFSKSLDFGHLTNYVVYAGRCHNEVGVSCRLPGEC